VPASGPTDAAGATIPLTARRAGAAGRFPRATSRVVLAALALLSIAPPRVFAADWPPIAADERSLAAVDPDGPGAIILFEEAVVDDRRPEGRLQTLHRRLKILTDAGGPWADVTLRVDEPLERLVDFAARTVTADGRELTLTSGDGTRARGADGRVEIRFRLPAAEPGAIIEYRYALLGGAPPPVGGWVFQHDIPCRRSTFDWHPRLDVTSRWVLLSADRYDPRVEPLFRRDAPDSLDAARFEIVDLPAAPAEPWGPPPLEGRARVVTIYDETNLAPAGYWTGFTRAAREREREFAAGADRLRDELAALGPPPADFEGRVRRAYEFVQRRIRNTAARGDVSLPVPPNADSLLAAGAGDPDALNLLFIAALDEFDIPATRAFVVDRDRAFFHADVLSPAQFHRTLVLVQPAPDRAFFFAPGTPFAPPGFIPWYVQGVTAVAAADSGARFVPTPIDPARVNGVKRTTRLTLDERGGLRGRVTLELSGQPELEARQTLAVAGPDGLERDLLEEWRRALPGVVIDSLTARHVTALDRNLAVDVVFTAPSASRRIDAELLLNLAGVARMPANPLGRGEVPRVSPVLPRWPEVQEDYVTLSLPREWRVETLPEPVSFANEYGRYDARWLYDGRDLLYERILRLEAAWVAPDREPVLRELFDSVTRGDAVLTALGYRPVPPSRR
jgi:hypothetical protein